MQRPQIKPTGATHVINMTADQFSAVLSGEQTACLRGPIDRAVGVGDQLCLLESDAAGNRTGRRCYRAVSHVLEGPPYLPPKMAVLSLRFPFDELRFITPAELDVFAAQRITARLAARCRKQHRVTRRADGKPAVPEPGAAPATRCACLFGETDESSAMFCAVLAQLQAGGDEAEWLSKARSLALKLPELASDAEEHHA